MRLFILTLFICAIMSVIAAFALLAEGEHLWSMLGAVIGFLLARSAQWFDKYHS
ncbi:MAG: hypothetical protein ACRCXB_26575 [Aeromonadaceae bacterium]